MLGVYKVFGKICPHLIVEAKLTLNALMAFVGHPVPAHYLDTSDLAKLTLNALMACCMIQRGTGRPPPYNDVDAYATLN